MPIELYQNGVLIGSVVRCSGGACYCYGPDGAALGQVVNLDAAANLLARRASTTAA